MSWTLFEHNDARGTRVIKDWVLDKAVRIKLEQRLDLLRQMGPDVPANLVSGTGIGGHHHVRKFKVKGRVQLRPMLCKGPIGNDEFTFLERATERDGKITPPNAPDSAERRRQEVLADSGARRSKL